MDVSRSLEVEIHKPSGCRRCPRAELDARPDARRPRLRGADASPDLACRRHDEERRPSGDEPLPERDNR
jgi:hypothetical protein